MITCTAAPVPSLNADAQAKQFAPDPNALTVYVVRRNWGDGRNFVKVQADDGATVETLPNTMVRYRLKPGSHTIAFDFEGPPAGRIPSPSPAAVPQGGVGSGSGEPPGQSGVPLGHLTCPKCGMGRIIEGRRGFGCDRYREGCDFVVWKEVSGRLLTQDEIRRLIATGHTLSLIHI